MKLSKELWDKLVKYGQEHLAVGFDELSDEEAKSFEKELSEIEKYNIQLIYAEENRR